MNICYVYIAPEVEHTYIINFNHIKKCMLLMNTYLVDLHILSLLSL